MKALAFVVLFGVGAVAGGAAVSWWPDSYGHVAVAAGTANEEREILYYRHPHNPSVTSPEPRKDEMGMDFIPIYAGGGDALPGTVSISPVVQQNLNVRIGSVARGDLARLVETVGFVDYDESRLSHVHLRTQGWIEDLSVRTTGERVEEGQLLFRLYSPELVNAQEELLHVVRRGGSASSARERLRALGVSATEVAEIERAGQPRRLISVRAGQGGVVEALNVREGMYVTPGTEVMTIADLSQVWVIADLFEHQVDAVARGDAAHVKLPFRPGERLEGRVDYIYPSLNSPTRTVQVRLAFDNPGERLKPGMYADVQLTTRPLQGVLYLPAEAVIRTGRQDRVILALGEGHFQARGVQVGRRANGDLEIIEGLKEGERVVLSGHFLLDSEASASAELGRMSEANEEEGDDEVWAEGRLLGIDYDARVLNVDHGPVPLLGWPAMVMEFAVADDLGLDGLHDDMAMRFRMREREEFVYEITAIEPMAHDH
ncbi:efflux RND transporter periplasmic adaptor subunit [Halomonas sp. MCCC 1A17488]|uniref:efflux RND transporter periplasmic adaptor subunit n=1 Tax=unclassified Halomonas TaxID=2609666 RepID=UPI0018D21E4D|nr:MULTISPECIES: efflux RND transporter periplasmic adaptor subunit [unclassified Halomonas]MCE8015980.1 efflux RND transporter periplasmic adaptor subunit [Halomonas sp. MCCC 1A17488]MCG3239313.1 efflux RND transporter periplasmic adaptor subunit [Halomonas sp. MCCC 1A17488]QPP50755.1 efflux RND transporter periplasmic adaptor subunit [Halomonas sp. SS10-MC5]